MDEYRAKGIEQRSGFGSRGPFGDHIVKAYSWRRGQDRGKRRLTHGIYGTKIQLMEGLAKGTRSTDGLIWTEFRNGKFMVW